MNAQQREQMTKMCLVCLNYKRLEEKCKYDYVKLDKVTKLCSSFNQGSWL